MTFLQLIRREIHGSLPKLIFVSAVAGVSNAAILTAINTATGDISDGKNPSLWSVALFLASLFLFIKSQLYVTITTTAEIEGIIRGGPGCLNRFSASISGASAGVRLPSGVAAG
jgi:hypothetical protein